MAEGDGMTSAIADIAEGGAKVEIRPQRPGVPRDRICQNLGARVGLSPLSRACLFCLGVRLEPFEHGRRARVAVGCSALSLKRAWLGLGWLWVVFGG